MASEADELKRDVLRLKQKEEETRKAHGTEVETLQTEVAALQKEVADSRADAESQQAILAAETTRVTEAKAALERKYKRECVASGELRAQVSALKASNARLQTEHAGILTENATLYAENTKFRLRELSKGHGSADVALKVEDK